MPPRSLYRLASSLLGTGPLLLAVACTAGTACSSGARNSRGTSDDQGSDITTVASTLASTNTAAPVSENAGVVAPRIRRLTNAEYDATVQALLGTELTLSAGFVPDARLHKYAGFDRNEAQVVDPMLARQLQLAAEHLAAQYVAEKLPAVPCSSSGDAVCARQFFSDFLPKALRRSEVATELDDLLTHVVLPSLARDGFVLAVQLGLEAVLQSSGFLYHTELGSNEQGQADSITLTREEIANALAYLVTGAPPDATLVADDQLLDSLVRAAHVRRLFQTPAARPQVQRMVKQWLGLDQVANLLKDSNKFAAFSGLRRSLARETDDFITDVVFNRNSGFQLLMSADYTIADEQLATLYGVSAPETAPGFIDLQTVPRRGILNQGAFLAVNATPILPSPVKRGARLLTQVLCLDPGDPGALMISVTPPQLDATKTTRQRFEEHNSGTCATCHRMIDSVGFTFEHFNAMGAWEPNEDGDAGLPIDSATTLALPADVDFGSQAVVDSAELSTLVSESAVGQRCFARNLARFTLATYGTAVEQAFVDEWQRLAAGGQDNVQELLVAFVSIESFVRRTAGGTL